MRALWLAPILVAIVAGCNLGGSSVPAGKAAAADARAGDGPRVEELKEFGSGCPTTKEARLEIAGSPVDVLIECDERDPAGTRVKLLAHGQSFEEEVYKVTDREFLLVEAGGEAYNPPLPLAKAAMKVGDTWTWEGKVGSGEMARNVKATVVSASEKVFVPVTADALKVEVQLEMSSGIATPARRALTFWLVPGQGVVKRQFGSSSVRRPIEK